MSGSNSEHGGINHGKEIFDGFKNAVKGKANEIKNKAGATALSLTGKRGETAGEGLADIYNIPGKYLLKESIIDNIGDRISEIAYTGKTTIGNVLNQGGEVASTVTHPIQSLMHPLTTIKKVAMTPVVVATETADAVTSAMGIASKIPTSAWKGISKSMDAIADDITSIPIINRIPIVKFVPKILAGGINVTNKILSTPSTIIDKTREKVGGVLDSFFGKMRSFASGSESGPAQESPPHEAATA